VFRLNVETFPSSATARGPGRRISQGGGSVARGREP
jgi:hypothetical protein